MSCDRYQERELGRLDESAFQAHLKDCDICRERLRQDEAIDELAANLEEVTEPPFLWERIEGALRTEQRRARRRAWVYRVAAVLVVSLGLGALMQQGRGIPEPATGLYTAEALEKVRDREREYAAAIEELEQIAGERMERMDAELAFLYRDKIATIDTQIDRCLQALSGNPANTHIRRYLLLALRDKRETLEEIVQLKL
ncbi:MAG: hypothetical protein OXG13_17520 [Gemmatimonadaceae bacterium]|nr:hypothetical protein [Gemmatimonadaceae bacterium]